MQLILFDIDGTLIRGEGMGSLAMKRALEETYNVSAVSDDRLTSIPFNGRSDPAILADMAELLGILPDVFDRGFSRYKSTFMKKLTQTVADSRTKRVLPGVNEVLEHLHGHPHVQLGLVTGNFHGGARIKLEPFQLNEYFPFGGFGDDGADRRDIVEAAHARGEKHLNRRVPADSVLVIGDTVHDVAAAQAHNFAAIGLETGGVSGEDFAAAQADAWFPHINAEFSEFVDAWVGRKRQPVK